MVGGALLDRRLGDTDRAGDSRPAAGGSRGPAARADLEPRGGPQSAGARVHHPGGQRPAGAGAGRSSRPDPAHEREDAGVTVRLIDATRRWFLGLLAAALLTLPAAAQPQPALPHSDLVIETDRKSVVEGKSVSVRVSPGRRRLIKKTKTLTHQEAR